MTSTSKKTRDIPAEEEANERWRLYRSTRDAELKARLREELILAHLPVVGYVARRMIGRLHASVEIDDLTQSGYFGLMEAVDRFDPDRGVRFATFASLRIQGAMNDSLRAKAWGSRRQRAQHRLVEGAQQELSHELGRMPTDQEVAERLGVEVADVRAAVTHFDASQVGSLNAPLESGGEIGDLVAGQHDGELEARIMELGPRLAEKMSSLPESERLLLSWIYVDKRPRKEIAKMLGTGESWLSHLHTKAMNGLQAAMAGSVS